MIVAKQIAYTDPAWADAREIRITVFVEEQRVPAEEELDEYEETARHFLVYADGKPAGTCRWRYTDKGVKLERFAVHQQFRGMGIGGTLLKAAMDDVSQYPESQGKTRYLHSQVTAMFLYRSGGFEPVGEQFDECGIMHYKMVWRDPSADTQ